MKQKLGVGLSLSSHHMSSCAKHRSSSLASAKGLPGHVAGGWCQSLSRRAACCRDPSMLSLCTRWQHPSIISSGDLARATVKLIALGYSHCHGAINSRYHCIFNFVSCISSATYLKYLTLSSYLYGGGRLCTYCSATLALYFPPTV